MQRRDMIVLLSSAALGGNGALQASVKGAQGQSTQDHVAWVAGILKRMGTITPGMTRRSLLAVFTTEGGLSTRSRRTFVSRDCPFFKVDVEFQPLNQMNQQENGRAGLVERSEDIILTISAPYLQFSVID